MHATPAATKGSARQPTVNHKGGHAEEDPPKKPVWRRREPSGSATSRFWRGRVSAGITHRQGNATCNLKKILNSNLSRSLAADAKRVELNWFSQPSSLYC
eukprot:7979823-Ditylum_brightwellii.AAC.1